MCKVVEQLRADPVPVGGDVGRSAWVAMCAAALVACGGHALEAETGPASPPASTDAAAQAQASPDAVAPKVPKAPWTPDAAKGPGLRALMPRVHPPGSRPLTLQAIMNMHGVPTDAQWRALPPDTDPALRAIAQDSQGRLTDRIRAIAGIAMRQSPDGLALLVAIAGTAEQHPALRRAAIRALADGYIARGSTDAFETVRATLTSADPLIRETAVKSLIPHVHRPHVKAALGDTLERESVEHIKQSIRGALTPSDNGSARP